MCLKGGKGISNAGAECQLCNGSTKAGARIPYDLLNGFRVLWDTDIKCPPYAFYQAPTFLCFHA